MRTLALGVSIIAAGTAVHAMSLPAPAPAPQASDAMTTGAQIYRVKGCYQCHGNAGEGALGVGPRLSPSARPLGGFIAYVRAPTRQMPKYSRVLISDQELALVYNHLQSLPKGRVARDVPELARFVTPGDTSPGRSAQSAKAATPQVRPAAAVSAKGAATYQQYCSSCHGTNRQGALAPALIKKPYTPEQVLAVLRDPPAGMPRFVPGILNERDARVLAADVAARSSDRTR